MPRWNANQDWVLSLHLRHLHPNLAYTWSGPQFGPDKLWEQTHVGMLPPGSGPMRWRSTWSLRNFR